MKKRMLEKYTSRYDKVPSWLMIMLSCFIAFGYVLIGGFLAGIAVGIPLFIVFAFLMLNGNIQLQDVNTISFNLFSTLYFQLGVFVFTLHSKGLATIPLTMGHKFGETQKIKSARGSGPA